MKIEYPGFDILIMTFPSNWGEGVEHHNQRLWVELFDYEKGVGHFSNGVRGLQKIIIWGDWEGGVEDLK